MDSQVLPGIETFYPQIVQHRLNSPYPAESFRTTWTSHPFGSPDDTRRDSPVSDMSYSSREAVSGRRRRAPSGTDNRHTNQQKGFRGRQAAQFKGLNDLGIKNGFESSRRQTGHGTLNRRSNAGQSHLTHQKAYVVQCGIDMSSMFSFLLEVCGLSAEQIKVLLKDILVLKGPNGEEEDLPDWPAPTEIMEVQVRAENARAQRTRRQCSLLLERLADQVTINGRHDLSRLLSDHRSRMPTL